MPSFEKNKSSGLWSVRFREVDAENGKMSNKRLSGFKTKRDAQYGYEDYVAEQKRLLERKKELTPPAPGDINFNVLAEEYLAFKKTRLKETSFYDVEKKITTKIIPFLGDKRVRDITPKIIIDWQNTLSEYSYAYKKSLMTHLSLIFGYAERYHDITNIMKKVDKPRNLEAKKEMLFWSPEEFSLFIKEVAREDYALFFCFLYLTGCRRGEALALTWSDIDLKNGTVSITKSVSNKAHDEGKSYTITTPKNAGSNRTISIPSFLCDALRKAQKKAQEGDQYVFGGKDPFPPTNLERTLTKAAAAAGVKRIRIHDLRHSCASLLIHKGVTIVAVSRHLGHTTVEQTLNTYSHMMPDDRTMILKTLSSVESQILNKTK